MIEALLQLEPNLLLAFIVAYCTSLTCFTALFAYYLAYRNFSINKHADLGAVFVSRRFGTSESTYEDGSKRESLSVTIKYRIENHSKATITIDDVTLPPLIFNFAASLVGVGDKVSQVDFDQYGDRNDSENSLSYGQNPEDRSYAHILRPGEMRLLNVYVSMNSKKYPKALLSFLMKRTYLISRYSGDNKARKIKHSLNMRANLSLKERHELEKAGYYKEKFFKRLHRWLVSQHLKSYRAPSIKSSGLKARP